MKGSEPLMSKIHIKVQLPSEYAVLHVVKRVNYPFNQSSRQFMLAVIRLAEREQLDAYSAFGRIGHALAKDTPMDWVTDSDELVRVDYKESDEDIIAFYRQSPMTNKQITTMFLRLMVRLCYTHGPHLADLVYLIDTLPAPDAVPTVETTQPAPAPARVQYAPKAQTTQRTPEAEEEQPKPVIKRRKITVPQPEPKEEVKDEPIEEPKDDVVEEPKDEPEQDDFLTRAQKVRAKAQEALDDEVTVKQNPLLADFYDEF